MPELGQTFSGGACVRPMSLAALETLIAGVRVRCEVSSGTGMVAKVVSPNGVDIGRKLVSTGWALRRLDLASHQPGVCGQPIY